MGLDKTRVCMQSYCELRTNKRLSGFFCLSVYNFFSCIPDKEIRGFCLVQKFLSHSCYLTSKRKFSREFGLNWLCRTSDNFVVRLTSLRRHNDVKLKENPTSSSFCVVINASFKIKQLNSKGMQEKSNTGVRCG